MLPNLWRKDLAVPTSLAMSTRLGLEDKGYDYKIAKCLFIDSLLFFFLKKLQGLIFRSILRGLCALRIVCVQVTLTLDLRLFAGQTLYFLDSVQKHICHYDTPCYEGPQKRIVRTLSWTVWRVFHVIFLKSESKSHPSEKLCGSLTVHLLVSQVPSLVLQRALTFGFADSLASLDFEASFLLPWTLIIHGLSNGRSPNFTQLSGFV